MRSYKLLIAVLVCSVLSAGSARAQSCMAARDWAAANRDKLPKTYAAFGELPVEYRRAAYQFTSDTLKSDFWREHLENYLTNHPQLTDDQRQVLLEGIQMVTPQFFAALSQKDDNLIKRRSRAQLSFLEVRAQAVLSHQQIGEIFAQLGPATSEFVLLAPQGDQPKVIPIRPSCSCAQTHDFCPNGAGCGRGAGCVGTSVGCGWIWVNGCNGSCYYVGG